MNHSGAFWKVRNTYAGELKTLWEKGYTGEGMWSRGFTLYSGQYERHSLEDGEVLPEHLCGGTYRSSGKRKRKVKKKLSYKEREARRIAKKFGTNGMALGADEETKVKLEKGKKTAAKPRVAGSSRGRELRAAAALARFEIKSGEPDVKDEEEEMESGTGSDDSDADADEAIDIDGKRMRDGQGRSLVKVCEDEKEDDANAQNEKSELRSFDNGKESNGPQTSRIDKSGHIEDDPPMSKEPSAMARKVKEMKEVSHSPVSRKMTSQARREAAMDQTVFCPACSMENDPRASTCFVCANVLDPRGVLSIWQCERDVCKGGKYINAGDCGVCGVCGARKCSNGI
jgi:DNA-dependent metalloprotease WSS1